MVFGNENNKNIFINLFISSLPF
jgi:hypothetical protein